MAALSPDYEAGMRSAFELIHAVHHNDMPRVHDALTHCDPAGTILALISAWVSLADYLGADKDALLASMGEQVDTDPLGNGTRS